MEIQSPFLHLTQAELNGAYGLSPAWKSKPGPLESLIWASVGQLGNHCDLEDNLGSVRRLYGTDGLRGGLRKSFMAARRKEPGRRSRGIEQTAWDCGPRADVRGDRGQVTAETLASDRSSHITKQ